jgi:flavorubredoxin
MTKVTSVLRLLYKYQTDNDELSYFIVNKVPIIIDNTMGKYKQFFYEELSMLVEQTKRYKDLKTYLDSTSDMLPI